MEILLYITDNKERILGGDPLTLYMQNNAERQEYLHTLAEMLDTEVIQMENGDHIMFKR